MLLCRPNPIPDESWRGYLLRLTEANLAPSPLSLLAACEVDEKVARRSIADIQTLSSISGKSEVVLGKIFPKLRSIGVYDYSGHRLPKCLIRFNQPHICPNCISEDGYIKALWDINTLNVCHTHNRLLITTCPDCYKKLTWNRPAMLKCKCGFDLLTAPIVRAAEEENSYALCVTSIFGRTSEYINNTSIPNSFFNMGLKTFVSVVNIMGLKRVKIHNIQNNRMGKFGSPEALFEGIKIINNWEVEFTKLIFENSEITPKAFGTIRLNYAKLYGALFKKGFPAEEMQFIKDSFRKAALQDNDKIFFNSRFMKNFSINTNELRYLGISQTCRLLNRQPSTIKNLIKIGKIKVLENVNKNGNIRQVIDINSLELKLNSNKGDLSLRNAATYIGLPVSVIQALRKSNHIRSDYNVIRKKSWAIKDLEQFHLKLKELSKYGNPNDCIDKIELKQVMKYYHFSSTEMKADVIRRIMDRKIKVYGNSKDLSQLYISKSVLYDLPKFLS